MTRVSIASSIFTIVIMVSMFIRRLMCCNVLDFSNHSEVVYLLGNQTYRMYIPKILRFSSIACVTSGGIDITSKFNEYLGPQMDFHGIYMTPKLLGYDSVTITYRNLEERTFTNDDIIDRIQPDE